MIRLTIALCVLTLTGCGHSPTAPTAAAPAAAMAALSDPRYDASFFASFAGGRTRRPSLTVYIADTDDKHNAVPAETVTQATDAAVTLQAAIGLPVDVRSMRGVDIRAILAGLSVQFLWTAETGVATGGHVTAYLPGVAFVHYRAVTYDVCGGLAKTVVRHELMHAMGFSHTDDPQEVMYPELRFCDRLPSAREIYHARVALGMGER
ncbi:MAG: hypothetical protein ACKVQA_06890 [Burkholderiales bacterium]